jgi:hypothetical protein
VSQPFLMKNLLLEIPYKFKKSCGGTPEPQTTQDALWHIPWLHGPSLKKTKPNTTPTCYDTGELKFLVLDSESDDSRPVNVWHRAE